MEYLNTYLNEISRRLPRKNRVDIIEEIRSLLMDIIEERSPGANPDEATVKAVLKDYGSPHQVAQQYIDYQPLIGPELYPIYQLVLKIVLIVIAALNLVGVLIAIVSGVFIETSLFIAIVDRFFDLVGSLVNVFGIVTLVFFLFERLASKEFKKEVKEDWSPDDLSLTEDKTRISIPEIIAEITLGVIFIVLINVFLEKIGIYFRKDTGWAFTPFLNMHVLRYIPRLTASIVLDIGLNLYLIRQGAWNRAAIVAKIIINLFKIALFAAIIFGPAILSIEPTAWEALNLDLTLTAQRFNQLINTALSAVLGLTILSLTIDVMRHLVQTFVKKEAAGLKIKTG
ncbi:MAG: hypothetical protein GX142_04380 [Chloroflexi bacterium]|jgi:hypothetical protein|nr:hypothetical protein [Chloroflexota bacterium]